MSHLERALRRSRAENADADHRGGERTLPPRTPNAAFAPPWAFDEVRPSGPSVAPIRDEAVTPPASAAPVGPPAALPGPVQGHPDVKFADFDSAVRSKLVVGDRASAVMREQFRKIAASLYRLREQRPLGVVMVVSAVPGEGKTLTSTNLALTLSESYLSRVLLVDADLRRPTVHTVFGLPNKVGLKDDLAAVPDRPLSTVKVSTQLEVLTAGSAQMDPMGALTSERLRFLLRRASQEFEWVLIDTPPAELLPDAKILASLADAAVLVVEAGSTNCDQAQRAVEAIGHDRIVGVVLNQVSEPKNLDRYYGYYGDSRQRQGTHENA